MLIFFSFRVGNMALCLGLESSDIPDLLEAKQRQSWLVFV